MKTLSQRRNKIKRTNELERLTAKQARSPIVEEIKVNGVIYQTLLSKEYAQLLEAADNYELLEYAMKYDLPITETDRYLLAGGDTYLDEFDKIELSAEDQEKLINEDWSPILSSNIKAVKIVGADLMIWFHNDMIYTYNGKADMYYAFNEALSPGRLLWRTIRGMWSSKKLA